jgi:sterol desaturase/sphingolipid hydroxylase (fatty acid hydroxylase superfamily)
MAATPRRVTVVSPRTTAARTRRVAVTEEIDEQTGVGDAFMQSLIRSQLRLGLLVLAALGAVVGLLPLLFAVAPGVRNTDVLGVPLAWIVLGFLVYPVLAALGWFYVRQAEGTERDFAELVERE